jgi:hypothetical protein
MEFYKTDVKWANVDKNIAERKLKECKEYSKSLETAYRQNLETLEYYNSFLSHSLILQEDLVISLKKGTIIIPPEKIQEAKNG